jgi:hypothetical protein
MRHHSRVAVALCLLFAWIAVGTVAPVAAAKGRYKVGSDGKCYWDAKDDGPNQCTPPKLGRFKADGDKCYWDAKDDGPDQCKPKKGRFKKDGVNCVWAPNDAGPNQCDPRAK